MFAKVAAGTGADVVLDNPISLPTKFKTHPATFLKMFIDTIILRLVEVMPKADTAGRTDMGDLLFGLFGSRW